MQIAGRPVLALEQPVGQWTSFQPDPLKPDAHAIQGARDVLRIADGLELPADPAILIDDADRGPLYRSIQSTLGLHAALPS